MKWRYYAVVQRRPNTVWQLRENHFSTLARSLKRVGVSETAIGASTLPARVGPSLRGSVVWQVEQDCVPGSPVPGVARKKARPCAAEKPANFGFSCRARAAYCSS